MIKYFGIGLPRTGTSSLHHAFLALGLRSIHHHADARTRRQVELADYRLEIMEHTDLLCDHATPIIFPQLLTAFPDARFIYTLRDEDSWIKSLKKVDFTQVPARVGSFRYYARLSVFGCAVFNEERYRWVFKDHDRRVRSFFTGDLADRLLEFDISRGDGFETLCPFLGLPVPEIAYPHFNKEGVVQRGKPSIKRRIQRRWRELVD